MPRGRGLGCGPSRGELTRLRRQVQTLKVKLRDANTGRFKKKTACVRLPPHEEYAKQYQTVRLQHLTNTDLRASINFPPMMMSLASLFAH